MLSSLVYVVFDVLSNFDSCRFDVKIKSKFYIRRWLSVKSIVFVAKYPKAEVELVLFGFFVSDN